MTAEYQTATELPEATLLVPLSSAGWAPGVGGQVALPVVVGGGRLPQALPGVVSRPLDAVGHRKLLDRRYFFLQFRVLRTVVAIQREQPVTSIQTTAPLPELKPPEVTATNKVINT